MMKSTIEYLHHFTCSECIGWWSVASHENYRPKKMYCPHCGHYHEEIVRHDVETGNIQYDLFQDD